MKTPPFEIGDILQDSQIVENNKGNYDSIWGTVYVNDEMKDGRLKCTEYGNFIGNIKQRTIILGEPWSGCNGLFSHYVKIF